MVPLGAPRHTHTPVGTAVAAAVLAAVMLAAGCSEGGGRVLPPPTTVTTAGADADRAVDPIGSAAGEAAAPTAPAGSNSTDQQGSTPDGGPAATTTATTTYVGQEFDDTSPNTYGPIPSEDGCDPGYAGTCVPPPPARITCDDLTERNILVTGNDPHGLDPDADGMACPSELPPSTDPPGQQPEPLD